jgi:hypothetical protein
MFCQLRAPKLPLGGLGVPSIPQLARSFKAGNVLNSKWNLKCYKSKRVDSYRIIIPPYSVPHLQGLLKDIMPPMMLFKLGL